MSKVVGRQGVVLTWFPPDLDDLGRSNGVEVVGYKIFVDGRQKQLVTNAHLTKVKYTQAYKFLSPEHLVS